MATFKYYDGTKYNRITGGLVPKTTKTTSDTETYSCNYVNNEVDKLLPENSKTTGTTNTYSCDYINGIIESGSNDNGNWIKFSDGTMICTLREYVSIAVTTALNGLYTSDTVNLPYFPVSFVGDTPKVVKNWENATWAWQEVFALQNYGYPSLTNPGDFRLIASVSVEKRACGGYVSVIAIGRWK